MNKILNKWFLIGSIVGLSLGIMGSISSGINYFAKKEEVENIVKMIDKRLDRMEDLLYEILIKKEEK